MRLHRLLSTLTSACAALAIGSLSGQASAAGYTALTIFGDSLSDSGNVAALVGSNGAQVVSGNGYIPGAPYASGQFTNGNVWAVGFAAALGLPAGGVASLSGGRDYAFGGARTAADGTGQPPSLKTQANTFLAVSGGVAASGGLYVIEGGGNDARDTLAAAAAAGSQAAAAAVIGAAAASFAQGIGNIVDQLQAAGAINIIVWDVPNLALAPAVTVQGAAATFLGGQVVQAMNAALASRLSSEVGVKLFDVYGLQTTLAANPSAYGLGNVTDACGAPGVCNAANALFWDGIHPTAYGHSLLAQAMLVTAVPEPASIALLVGGLLLVSWRVRRHG